MPSRQALIIAAEEEMLSWCGVGIRLHIHRLQNRPELDPAIGGESQSSLSSRPPEVDRAAANSFLPTCECCGVPADGHSIIPPHEDKPMLNALMVSAFEEHASLTVPTALMACLEIKFGHPSTDQAMANSFHITTACL